MIFDIDHFKAYNDLYGHEEGDQCLKKIASMTSEYTCEKKGLLARYGGEEFAFLFPESSVEQARTLVERFRLRFAEHDIRLPDGVLVRATLSIGVADASHRPLEAALQRADFALYEAKRQGRNRVIVATGGA